MSFANPIMDATLNQINLEEIKREKGDGNWSHALVNLDHVRSTVIHQNPGTVNDNHVHDYDEWWVIMQGEIHWVIEGREEKVIAKPGDFVFVPALTFHHIFPVGDGPSIRLGVSLPGKGHLHERPEKKAEITIA
ncbi:MAG: hypothetical protein CME26_08480 [Gemmatimonadetes bacterium]|nr:hypothetical protein [Gemmatimonadota bacterium]|tara:strand:- start:5111 stop:5512 length:402 start_codon:yes stop_codon:yes gene_type:complete